MTHPRAGSSAPAAAPSPRGTSRTRSAARTPAAATTSTTSSAASSTSTPCASPRTTPSRTRSSATGSCSTPTTSRVDGGIGDDEFCALVTELDERVAAVDGHGFAATPFGRSEELSDRLGFSADGGVWVKDETGNVSGSHKARHLFGVLL